MTTTEERIREYIKSTPVLLFMKGTPDEPKCGFSGRAVAALNAAGINFSAIDVLAAPRIREALPRVTQFPTFPQLFVSGELIGGSDIVHEMTKTGELQRLVASAGAAGVATQPLTDSQAGA